MDVGGDQECLRAAPGGTDAPAPWSATAGSRPRRKRSRGASRAASEPPLPTRCSSGCRPHGCRGPPGLGSERTRRRRTQREEQHERWRNLATIGYGEFQKTRTRDDPHKNLEHETGTALGHGDDETGKVFLKNPERVAKELGERAEEDLQERTRQADNDGNDEVNELQCAHVTLPLLQDANADKTTSDKATTTDVLSFATSPLDVVYDYCKGRLLTQEKHEGETGRGLLLDELMEDLYQELEEASLDWQKMYYVTGVPMATLTDDGFLHFLGVDEATTGGYDTD